MTTDTTQTASSIWDAVRGGFKDFLDFRINEQELRLAKEARAAESAQARAAAPASVSAGNTTGTLLLVGGLAVAGIVAIRLLR